MITERLVSVIGILAEDNSALNIAGEMQNVANTLSSAVTAPQAPHDEAFKVALDSLRRALIQCRSNEFPLSKVKILDEIQGVERTGLGLLNKVEQILHDNNLTRANALTQIQDLSVRTNEFYGMVNALRTTFANLEIKGSDSEKQEYELGVLLPRELVGNTLHGLQKELRKLSLALRVFPEITGEGAPDLELRSIGTGSLEFFMALEPTTAACLAFTIERIVELYKKALEIRVLEAKVKELKLSEQTSKALKGDESKLLDAGIDQIKVEVMEKYCRVTQKDRKNEIEIHLKQTIRTIASRFDHGVNFEVSPPAALDVRPQEQAVAAPDENLKQVRATRTFLQEVEVRGEPMLGLPSPKEEIEEEEKEAKKKAAT